MNQDRIAELENELKLQQKERETYVGNNIKEIIDLYEKENKILEKIILTYRAELEDRIQELKILNSKRTQN